MSDEDAYVVIAVAPDYGVASSVRSLLEGEGLVVPGLASSGQAAAAGEIQAYKIDVLRKDAVRARELLQATLFERYLVD